MPVANVFRSPLGNGVNPLTEANDGDGYFVSSGYGPRNGTYHWGEDWVAEGSRSINGDPVYAVANGTVVSAGYNASVGNFLIIRHQLPDGTFVISGYAHLLNPPLVNSGSVAI